MSALIYVIVPKPLFGCCLQIHSFLCGTSNGTVSRNNRAEIRQLVILSNYYAHKTVALQLLIANASEIFSPQFPSRSEHCFFSLLIKCDSPTTLVVFFLSFIVWQRQLLLCRRHKRAKHPPLRNIKVILTSALSPAGRTVPDRVTQENVNKERKWETRGGGRRRASHQMVQWKEYTMVTLHWPIQGAYVSLYRTSIGRSDGECGIMFISGVDIIWESTLGWCLKIQYFIL